MLTSASVSGLKSPSCATGLLPSTTCCQRRCNMRRINSPDTTKPYGTVSPPKRRRTLDAPRLKLHIERRCSHILCGLLVTSSVTTASAQTSCKRRSSSTTSRRSTKLHPSTSNMDHSMKTNYKGRSIIQGTRCTCTNCSGLESYTVTSKLRSRLATERRPEWQQLTLRKT